jgi:hypothetical protein
MQQYSDIPFEIFTIENLYTDEEIKLFKDYVENSDEKNRTFTSSSFKNGKMINPDFSRLMYSRIKNYLPDEYIDRQNIKWKYLECPKYIMYAKVQINQKFGLHTDTGCEYDVLKNKYSKYTVLTYLNDDFLGGNTVFYNDKFEETYKIIPKKNLTLIFDIDLYHEGCEVVRGDKYWIGSELVCKKI